MGRLTPPLDDAGPVEATEALGGVRVTGEGAGAAALGVGAPTPLRADMTAKSFPLDRELMAAKSFPLGLLAAIGTFEGADDEAPVVDCDVDACCCCC